MPDPLALAQRRQEAVEALQATLADKVDDAQRSLLEGLLTRLTDLHADPTMLPGLLLEFQATVAAPLATYYGQQVLTLPALSESYFADLGVAGYSRLRQPLDSYLRGRLGLDAAGNPVAGGYVQALGADTLVQREVLQYAYSAQAAGVGLNAYRQGLTALVTGGDGAGLVQELYKQAFDDVNRADRVLQGMAAERLELGAFLYVGGLIKSTRPFCLVRNGKCFTAAEVAVFGTKEDKYGGYTNKSEGLFSGKSDPYEPKADLGGYGCRHGLSAVPNAVALRLRPDLMETDDGRLVIKEG